MKLACSMKSWKNTCLRCYELDLAGVWYHKCRAWYQNRRTELKIKRLFSKLSFNDSQPNARLFLKQRLAMKQRINWFLIHDSKQLIKKVFLDSLIRTCESKKLFLGSLIRISESKRLFLDTLVRNNFQKSRFLILWFETTSQKFWFLVHFSKQKQWNWITCFEPIVSLPISDSK